MPAVSVSYARDDDLRSAVIDFSGSGDTTIIAAAAGVIRVARLFLVCAGATALVFKDGSAALSGAVPLITGVPLILGFDTRSWFRCAPGHAFVVNSSNGVQVSGICYYTV